MPLVYLSLGSSSSVVFGWFVNITTVAGLIGWVVICGTYLRFFYGMRYQGINRDRKSTTQLTHITLLTQYRATIQEPDAAIHGLGHSGRFVPGDIILRI